jgi:pimeloyl-ACP methyl ester carboxylesterase
MPTFTHDGLTFHYRETGSGLAFIFQHGLGAEVSQTFSLFNPPPGIRMITLDCRGHGQTVPLGPEEKIQIPQYAEDVLALMDHLHLKKAVVGGISMGAATALHLALTHPERVLGLVLSRPAWLDSIRGSGLEIFGALAQLIRRYGAWEGASRFQGSDEFRRIRASSPDNALSLLAQFAHPRAEETVAKLERIPRHIPSHGREAWRRIQVPTLVLGNRLDGIHPFEFAEEFAREIPGATLRELTPKSVNKDQHAVDTQKALEEFLNPLAAN